MKSSSNPASATYECPACKDTGWILESVGGYDFSRACPCGRLEKERLAGMLRFADIPTEFAGQTVADFDASKYRMPESRKRAKMAKAVAERFVSEFERFQNQGKGLYFFSATRGSGKTRLAVSIANDLISQRRTAAKFATTLQILDQIKETWGRENTGSEGKLIRDIVSVPLLVIDDIGVEGGAGWIQERLYSILNGRMLSNKVTVFTSNCSMENLGLDGRITTRIEKMAVPIRFPEESVRSAMARDENEAFLDAIFST